MKSSFHIQYVVLFFVCLLLTLSCKKNSPEAVKDSSREMTSFNLKKADGTSFASGEVTVNFQEKNIYVTVPFNTSLNGLIPVINFKGSSVTPASEAAQNFNQPVTYTITAEDGSSVNYVVTVALAAAPPALVYMGASDNNFYALDAVTGNLKWKYTGTASFAYSSANYANGTIYVGGIDNYLYAFEALTGVVKWKKLLSSTGIESDAVFDNGTVYVGTNDDYLYALDANTGDTKWRYLTGGNVSASPAILNDVVYFGSSDSKLYALYKATGLLKWSFQTGAMINQSGPAIANGTVYVGSRDNYLYAVNANTGTQVWRYASNGVSMEQSSPTVANNIVYIGGWYNSPGNNLKGSLYAVNALTGQLIWEKLQNTAFSSSPCVASGNVYITGDDLKIHALNAASGTAIWEKLILPNSASPAVYNNIVYVGGGGTHFFYALDALTGMEKWKFPLPNGLMVSSPLIVAANGTAYYSGDSGSLQ